MFGVIRFYAHPKRMNQCRKFRGITDTAKCTILQRAEIPVIGPIITFDWTHMNISIWGFLQINLYSPTWVIYCIYSYSI